MKKYEIPLNMTFPGIRALFTTKMFLSDVKEMVRDMNVPEGKLYFPLQKHTDRIHVLEADLQPVIADAVLTARQGILLGVQVADCVPILLSDKITHTVGVIHAGWRGTAKGIIQETIQVMKDRFCALEDNIRIAIGPSIRKCCYEVGVEVVNDIRKVTGQGEYFTEQNGKYAIDLSNVNKIQVLSLGIPEKNIWQSRDCTFCKSDMYHSYRYTGSAKNGQYGLIGMF
jgi:YfiH family protein